MTNGWRKFNHIIKCTGGTVIDDYVNEFTICKIMCFRGHIWLDTGRRINSYLSVCPMCDELLSCNRYTLTYQLSLRGSKLVSAYFSYISAVVVQCIVGHKYEDIPWKLIKSDMYCPICKQISEDKDKLIDSFLIL